jgi:hypothetical protein
MLEGVLDFGKGRLLVDKFGELQIREHAVDFSIGALHDALDQPDRKLPAEHGDRL